MMDLIAYGPLVFESEQPVYDFAARGQAMSGVLPTLMVLLELLVLILELRYATLVFPYAWDTYYYPESAGSRITGRVYYSLCFYRWN
jgi:hypothetical protein